MSTIIKIPLPKLREVWKEVDSAKMKFIKLVDSDHNMLVGASINQDIPATKKNIETLLGLVSTPDGEYFIECRQTSKSAIRKYCIVKGNGVNLNTSVTPLASEISDYEYKSLFEMERAMNKILLENDILKAENEHLLVRVQELENELAEVPESLNDQPSVTQQLTEAIIPLASQYLPGLLDAVLSKYLPKSESVSSTAQPAPGAPGTTNTGLVRFSPEYYQYLKMIKINNPGEFNKELQFIAANYPHVMDQLSAML